VMATQLRPNKLRPTKTALVFVLGIIRIFLESG
jgi:hypothetical protein